MDYIPRQVSAAGVAGKDVVVCTATASGKSLCYNLPILEALVENPSATALYMFPTKALAQDQLRALKEFCAAAFGSKAPSMDIYDGDTPMVILTASSWSRYCNSHGAGTLCMHCLTL